MGSRQARLGPATAAQALSIVARAVLLVALGFLVFASEATAQILVLDQEPVDDAIVRLPFASDDGVAELRIESFTTPDAPIKVTQVVLWGFFLPEDEPAPTHTFHLIIEENPPSLPPAGPCSVFPTPVISDTGDDVLLSVGGIPVSVSRYRLVFTLDGRCVLDGLSPYRVWAYDRDAGSSHVFLWETGVLDAEHGTEGHVLREGASESFVGFDLAIQIEGKALTVEPPLDGSVLPGFFGANVLGVDAGGVVTSSIDFSGQAASPHGVVLSLDGEHVHVSFRFPGSIEKIELETGLVADSLQLAAELRPNNFADIDILPNTNFVAAGQDSALGLVHIDRDSGAKIGVVGAGHNYLGAAIVRLPAPVGGSARTPGASVQIWAGGFQNEIDVYDAVTLSLVDSFPLPPGVINTLTLTFSPTTNTVLLGETTIYELALDGSLVRTFDTPPGFGTFFQGVTRGPDGGVYAADCGKGNFYHWAADGTLLESVALHTVQCAGNIVWVGPPDLVFADGFEAGDTGSWN